MTNVYNTLKKPCLGLDGADGEIDYVVDLVEFFLQEGFAIFDVDEAAGVAVEEVHAGVEFVDGEEDALLAFTFGGAELGLVGEDGAAAGFVLFGDVDDEGGRHSFERCAVENFERAERFAFERELL